MGEKAKAKSHWPAFAGALLFAVVAALTDLRGLLWLIEQGYTHWKFGIEGYYEMSIWLMPWLVVFQAVVFLVVASIVIRLAPKIPWSACMMASVILGLGSGLQMVRVHRSELQSPKVGPREKAFQKTITLYSRSQSQRRDLGTELHFGETLLLWWERG